MSYKYETFFKDILINEYIYFASKNKKLVRVKHNEQSFIAMWTDEYVAESYLSQSSIDYDKIIRADIDRFVTYEMDDIFDKGDSVLVNISNDEKGQLVDIVKMTDELMSELDDVRMKEFVKDVAQYDEVYGLTNKGQNNFIMITDDDHNKPHIMPVWSIKSRARKVRDEDFEECDFIEIEGKVFGEWLDKLRDDDKAVAIDIKSGVVSRYSRFSPKTL
ncbi:Protein of uncharacterised function (DUF2750) [Staphylococcus saccharolyticus]|uniref:Protein of uncharacterized function (DUF2750) n=1 Tax=Staphylococcus saccharolyticus TaxID=33028 RepID=A0A380H466_9STAP|nr:Protein of uncharacterised function (DUF2750) [Staphylococcus saccharolyticus]